MLTNNPVTELPGYRFAVISKLGGLKALDFKEVTGKERKQAIQVPEEPLQNKW